MSGIELKDTPNNSKRQYSCYIYLHVRKLRHGAVESLPEHHPARKYLHQIQTYSCVLADLEFWAVTLLFFLTQRTKRQNNHPPGRDGEHREPP